MRQVQTQILLSKVSPAPTHCVHVSSKRGKQNSTSDLTWTSVFHSSYSCHWKMWVHAVCFWGSLVGLLPFLFLLWTCNHDFSIPKRWIDAFSGEKWWGGKKVSLKHFLVVKVSKEMITIPLSTWIPTLLLLTWSMQCLVLDPWHCWQDAAIPKVWDDTVTDAPPPRQCQP